MIYLDYSANTPVDEAVLERFCAVERSCPGNANSRHQAGAAAKAAIDEATQSIARSLHVQPAEIIYTSGASEANNFALKSIARSVTTANTSFPPRWSTPRSAAR